MYNTIIFSYIFTNNKLITKNNVYVIIITQYTIYRARFGEN